MYVHAHMTYRQREGNTHTRARIYIGTYRQKDTHANIHVSTACPNIYNYTHMHFPTSMLMPITGCDHLTVLHTQTPVARHHCVAERGSACFTQCTRPSRAFPQDGLNRQISSSTYALTHSMAIGNDKQGKHGGYFAQKTFSAFIKTLSRKVTSALNQHREPLIVVRRQRSAEASCRRTTKDLEVRSGAVACARSKESRSVSVSPIPHTQAAPVKRAWFPLRNRTRHPGTNRTRCAKYTSPNRTWCACSRRPIMSN
jgi:hypothetical protein